MLSLQVLGRLEASSSKAFFNTRSLSTAIPRFYATKPPPQPLADGKEASVFTSSPSAVRMRRHRFGTGDVKIVDGVKLSDSDWRRWQWLKQNEKLSPSVTLRDWVNQRYKWRNRVRGIKYLPKPREKPKTKEETSEEGLDGEAEGVTEEELQENMIIPTTKIVGHRIYLPNFIIRLTRNSTPAGRPYDPYIATFRVPRSLTKMDVKSYLMSVYGVETTFIRTENFISQITRNQQRSKGRTKSHRTYKRAIVGLVDPFYYPDAKEDMTTEEREAREEWEEENFSKKWMDELKKKQEERQRVGLLSTARRNWAPYELTGRKKILTEILKRRAEREGWGKGSDYSAETTTP